VWRTYYNFKKRHTQGLVESKTAVIETSRPTQRDWRRCRTKTPSRSRVQAAAVPADTQGPFPSDQVSGLLVRLGQSGVSVIRIYIGLDRHKINPLLLPNLNNLDETTPGLCKQSRYLSTLFDTFCNNTLVSRIPQTPHSTTPAATLPLNHLHRRRSINPHVSTSVSHVSCATSSAVRRPVQRQKWQINVYNAISNLNAISITHSRIPIVNVKVIS